MFKYDCPFYATTVTTHDGTFHPAVQEAGKPLARPYYWENVRFATEEEAYARACETVTDAWARMRPVTDEWNVFEV